MDWLELIPEGERAGIVIEHIRNKLRDDSFSADELSDALSEAPEECHGAVIAANTIKRAGLTLTDTDGNIIVQGNGKPWQKVPLTPKDRVEAAFKRLSPEGQQAAAERLEELALLEKYAKKEPSGEGNP